MFKELKKQSFVEREEEVIERWEKDNIFLRSIEEREGSPAYSFYDGPPFATGLPHYGHLLAGTLKDVVPRYKTMKGFQVQRRFGWDCHGLPIESEIEKMHDLAGAASIEEFGIARFNEECRKIVLRHASEWETTVKRMARWVDFNNIYRTMDSSYMESVWWVFKELYDKGLVYEGYKVMPFSAQLGTPLSNFEAGLNYKDVDDPSLTLHFPLVDEANTSLLIWTTTPWTLVSNLATMVGPTIDYVTIKDHASAKNYILAKSRLASYYKNSDDYTLLKTQKGTELAGLQYSPPFDYFAKHAEKGAFRVLLEDSVSTDDGTGIVHSAPAFGEVDFYACKAAGIDLVCPVDCNGHFTQAIEDYAGLFVKDADKSIIKRLKESGHVINHGTIRHRYPYCWRSDTPLIYKAVSSWFVAVEKIKDKLLAANSQINWTPSHLKEGRFGKWLEGARDWAISRNRYWGTPIPLWQSEDGDLLAIGSVEDLEKLSGKKVSDLHRHFIDDITFEKDGKTYKRISQVFDCWFESGSMPYAQNHYPFENKEFTHSTFPADFIAEGLDQTRGWFYTLTILSAALFDKPAFKNVIVNGIILAEDGAKMSKRLRNYPDPTVLINQYGADAIRLYMLQSPAVRAEDMSFSSKGVELTKRQVLIPLWNAFSFFITYARICDWTPPKKAPKLEQEIDQWILSQLHKLIHDVEVGMDKYLLSDAVDPFVNFINELTNWYIRRNRRRFWDAKAGIPNSEQALYTLYIVLLELSKIAAPFIPLLSESIYQVLKQSDMPDSVHLCDFPAYDESTRDRNLDASMAAVQTCVSLGHSLRKEHKLKVRQPLPAVHIASHDKELLAFLNQQNHLIAEELNVKKVVFHSDEKQFVSLEAKPHFRILGKKVGKLMKAVQAKIASFGTEELTLLENGDNVEIEVEGETIVLTPEDLEVHRHVNEGMVAVNEGKQTIVLDTHLDESLKEEGMAREIVNKINTMRRDAQFEVTDRIKVSIQSNNTVQNCYSHYKDYIDKEILAVNFSFNSCNGTEWDLNGETAIISIEKT